MRRKSNKMRDVSDKGSKPSDRPMKKGPSSKRKKSYYTLEVKTDEGEKVSMGFKFGKVIVYTAQGRTRQATRTEEKRYYKALAKKEKKHLGD